MRALLIKDGTIERIELEAAERDHGARHTRRLIGDWFSQCFCVPGVGGDRMLIGYCSDTFMLRFSAGEDVAWNVVLDKTLYREPYPIGSPIVVAAHRYGDTVDMLELEMSAIRVGAECYRAVTVAPGDIHPLLIPVLTFLPGYSL